jgi:G3E family GTPase
LADRIVITLCDAALPGALEALETRLAGINPGAGRVRAVHGAVDANWLLETGLARGATRLPDAAAWMNAGAYRIAGGATAHPRSGWGGTARRSATSRKGSRPCSNRRGRILRLKALAPTTKRPVAFHAVQHTLYLPARRLRGLTRTPHALLWSSSGTEDAFVQIFDLSSGLA